MRLLFTISLIALLPVRAVIAVDPPQKYALLIAVSDYDHDAMNETELAFPESDAKALGQLLRWAGYKVDRLLGEDATQAAIRKKFNDLSREGNQNGVALVAMFGRGIEIETDDGNRGAVNEGYFCPFDTTMRIAKDSQGRTMLGESNQPLTEPDPKSLIGLNELLTVLQVANAGKRVVFADCCHSFPGKTRGRTFGSSFRATDLPQNTAIFFGCSQNEQSFEREDWGHGAFTKCLLQEMQDLYAVGNVTTGALADRVKRDVPQLTAGGSSGKHQTPRIFATNSIDLQFTKMMNRHIFIGKMAGEEKDLVPGMRFRWCSHGSFAMGSPVRESGRHANENAIEVSLAGFWLGETEVTQAQWESLMRSRPWKGKDNLRSGRLEVTMVVKEGADFPASYVSHGDRGDGTIDPDSATEFCRRLTERERKAGRLPAGWKYALPTEAQWEYGCRAGTSTKFSFGDDDTQLSDYGWWGAKYGNAKGLGNTWKEHYPHRVALKKPNAWGLHDMHGNVWEWCADWFSDRLPGGGDPIVLTRGSIRVCRGGCWLLDPLSCRSALRSGGSPDNRNSVTGFRVAGVPCRD